ncbi:WG repeat-containing protein [Spirochaeta lutea]|uniref:WG repeat-containing protein n=1 Tax=Spirochaeta lutea TaxID=1480694 RepID=A0A098QZ98_9SPIO|nr:WG repeat-containing protein [Spirochaeta lutea]KGE72811.1 hypothetical protein DC28_05385 [Spirochaeta lutea]
MKTILFIFWIVFGLQGVFPDTAEGDYHRFYYMGKTGLLDQHLQVVLEPLYQELSLPSEGYCTYRLNDTTWGVVTLDGQTLFEVDAIRLYPVRDDLSLAIFNLGVGKQRYAEFLTLEGRNPFGVQYPSARPFGNGLAPVSSPVDSEQYTLINLQGTYLKMRPMLEIRPFQEGLAAAVTPENWAGFLDAQGRWAIRPEWTEIGDFHNGLALVHRFDYTYFINHQGEPVIDLNPKHIDDLPYENWFMNSRKVSGDGYVYALGTTDRAAPQPWNTRTLYYYRDGSQVFMSSFFAIGGDFEEGVASFTGMVDGELTRGFWDTTGQIVQVLPEGFIFVDEVFDSFGDYKSNYQNGWVPIMEKDYRTGTWEGWAFLNKEDEVIYVRDIMDQYYRNKESGEQ